MYWKYSAVIYTLLFTIVCGKVGLTHPGCRLMFFGGLLSLTCEMVILGYQWVNFKTPSQKEFKKWEKWSNGRINWYTQEIKRLDRELLELRGPK